MQLAERFHAARRDRTLVVAEGLHALKHALRFGAWPLVVATDDPAGLRTLAAQLAPDLAARLTGELELTVITGAQLASLVREVPQTRVVSLFSRPQVQLGQLLAPSDRPVVLLEDPRRMGNVGACVRVAAAAGAAGVITTGPRDPWQPEAVRGAAGLQFALPVLQIADVSELSAQVTARSHDALSTRSIVAMDGVPEAEELRPGGLVGSELLAFGTERHGLSGELLELAERRLRLPMREGVASLNLATAVAATLYRG